MHIKEFLDKSNKDIKIISNNKKFLGGINEKISYTMLLFYSI